MNDMGNFLAIAGAFGLLFAVAEILYHAARLPAEATRKIVHIGTGCLTLLFPLFLQNIVEVALLCCSFMVILLLSMRFHWLPSINAVERKSWGSLLYPVVVCCVYVFYMRYAAAGPRLFSPLYYYFTPILVMAICDPVAAAAGSIWRKHYPETAPGKTFAGSVAFFSSAVLLIACLCVYFAGGHLPVQGYVVICVMLAFVATLAERFSSRGWDNFTIPVVIAAGIQIIETGLKSFAG